MQGKSTRRFLVDTNLFIAAVKKWTRSTDLLVYLLNKPEIELIANDVLLGEYNRYALVFGVPDFFLHVCSVVKIENPSEENVIECKKFISESQIADVVHAATCLQSGAILISNDKHFDTIRNRKIIEVWKISEAIKLLL